VVEELGHPWLGDAMAARVDVHANQEITFFDLTLEDKIIVIASDGVWEFLEI